MDLPSATSGNERAAMESADQAREYIPPVETHLIHSRYVSQTFKIEVMQPVRKYGETVRFPVVYATDGNLTFDMFKAISYIIQSSGREVPRFILVGIGYPSDYPYAGAVLRRRDLTFAGYPKLSSTSPLQDGVLVAEDGSKSFCGGEDFQQFIEHELFPLINATCESIPGQRTYFGHSVGAGFGLFTLFTRSDLFNNYIVSSPGLAFHGESPGGVHYDNYDFLLREARRFIASRKSLSGVKVYMSVGADEEFELSLAQWQLTSSFYRMASLMKAAAIAGLELITEVLPGETHATTWPVAYIHGVRAVLGTRTR